MFALSVTAEQWELALWVLRTAGLILAMLVLTLALRQWRRSHERDAERMFEQLDLLRSELLLLQDRLERQPALAAPAMMRAPQAERPALPMPIAPSPRGYEVAVRLARNGATAEELISSCGLSRHEAQLLLRLHSKPEPAPAKEAAAKPVPAKPVAREVAGRRSRLSVVG